MEQPLSEGAKPSAPGFRHRMSDWLKLHELDPARCSAILARAAGAAGAGAGERSVARAALLDPPLAAQQAWALAAEAVGRRSPALRPLAVRARDTARTEFEPDETRFPRAFTLHDDGTGRPYVSCPYHGLAGDLLAVAHEFGHALQITAAGGVALTPVLREVCAFISEISFLSALKLDEPGYFPAAEAVWQADSRKQFTRDLAKLDSALRKNDPPYSYQWNYPVARILAIEAGRCLTDDQLPRLFEGQLPAPELCGLLGL